MIAGEPEVRGNVPSSSFDPYRWTDGAVTTSGGPDVERLPSGRGRELALDSLEVFLLGTFLRRYVTYCARRRHFTAMQGAVQLLAEIRRPLIHEKV